MRKEANREKQAIDDMYANLWREDSQKKIAFEEEVAKQRQQHSKDLANELRKQMAQLEENKQKEEKLKEEQLRLLVSGLLFFYLKIFISILLILNMRNMLEKKASYSGFLLIYGFI